MLLRRKLCAVAISAAVLFLMLASQSIQKKHFLSLKAPISWNIQRNPSLPLDASKGPDTVSDSSVSVRSQGPGSGFQAGPQYSGGARTDRGRSHAQARARVPLPQTSQGPGTPGRPCGCADACVSERGGSTWFAQHFHPEQQPLLQPEPKLEPAALQWWLGLQQSGTDQTLQEVTSQLFQVISPPPQRAEPLPSRCRSCAVVGNSGILRKSGNGKLIDTHTSVIRMNKAVTAGFEQDVGNRTTHHFLYPESAVDVVGGASLVLLPFKLRDLEWLRSALSTGHISMTYMRVKQRIKADREKVLVVNPEFFHYCHERWTEHHGRYPSTGMVAMIYALHVCDRVSVFGYGADQDGNWHHYWEENLYAGAFRKTGVHNADYEQQVIQRLAKEDRIKLYL